VVLAGALGVVAGIRLAHGEAEQLEGGHRQVEVDGDAVAQAAEVVSERKPGRVAHDLEGDFFAVRQLDETRGSGARLGDDGRHRALDLLVGTTIESYQRW
jgi:hypothetical protein